MKLLVSALLFSTLVSAQSLESTRKLCKGLTDTDITRAGKYPYPKRKKAFKRHVKQLCEKIELKHWLNQPLQAEEYAAIDTLKLMKASMYDKAKEDVTGMTILDKIKMGN
jgi:serine protease inhibitor ecotin